MRWAVLIPAFVATAFASPVERQAPFSYNETAVRHHNYHRANHSANPIVWDQTMADTALKIAQTCNFSHQMDVDGGGYGQNLAAGLTSKNISAAVTELWYNGEVNSFNALYGQAQPSYTNFGSWGHFSQMVWKGTSRLGCATTYCQNGLAGVGSNVPPYLTVCNYKAPGNYANQYAANIGASLNKPTVRWSTGQ